MIEVMGGGSRSCAIAHFSENGRSKMRKLFTTAALLLLIGVGPAVAQTKSTKGASDPANQSQIQRQVPLEAPIGHRQPRADQVPDTDLDDPNDPLMKENRALDRKIKSICRGC
jgi:hypothetical protein